MPFKNPADGKRYRDQYNRKYYQTHKDHLKRRMAEYRTSHAESVGKTKQVIAARNKKLWVAWLMEHNYTTCQCCGYYKSFAAIEYHHTNPAEKDFNVSTQLTHAFSEANREKVLLELAKCQTLCANCHREVHYGEQFKQE